MYNNIDLKIACENDDLFKIRSIINDFPQREIDKHLILACNSNHISFVKLLLSEYNANVNTSLGLALCNSCEYGFIDIVKILIEYGANVSINNNYPVRHTADRGNLEIMKLLLDNGAFINNIDLCLQRVCINGHVNIIEYLNDGENIKVCNGTYINMAWSFIYC